MYIEFKKIRFKNILSYGNQMTELDFNNGINIVTAANGSGKSTILDALTFCLFGKPYRDIKLNNLINEINEKDLYTEVTFNLGKDSYTIARGLKPTLLEITKNGQQLDLLSSKKLNQDEIDKLLGINIRLFKNIVATNVTNNTPFLSMSIGDQRALIENIFNIDILGLMCKDVKKRKTVNATNQQLKINEMNHINGRIEDNNRYIENMQKYIANFNETKEAAVNRIKQQIEEAEGKLTKAMKNVTTGQKALEKHVDELGSAPDASVYGQLSTKLGGANADKTRIEKTLKGLSTKNECPICGSPLNEGHAKAHIEQLNVELKNITESLIPQLAAGINDYQTQYADYKRKSEFVETIRTKLREESNLVTDLTGRIATLQESLATEENKECSITLDEYYENLKTLSAQLATVEQEISDYQHKIDIDTELVNILGDTGIKQYFFKKLILILNKNVNDYLTKFELPVKITFDDQMKVEIMKGRYPRIYNQFSGGERSRIDMSILLSFFNTSRIISNWSCNIIFIDELIDNGVDQSGIDQFLSTLYNIVNENKKKKLGIYIVSHKLTEPKIAINSVIKIDKKPGGFSTLEVK